MPFQILCQPQQAWYISVLLSRRTFWRSSWGRERNDVRVRRGFLRCGGEVSVVSFGSFRFGNDVTG